eukprot:CAMPEP_0174319596 /NCGR_PEP_ID=MMETSP0810-20121108/8972_1 /TAXON_ID=73025 ORGANISM="Eutreptiella gymnastica-like, Strain CCMP1594" /NCGR_SAMPLE_ID=MMETSP0810 /ASSEMBLY_ACC=CAM_ASM_000659 /LENGTH=63 /DNA_ID=CAMNT_0015430195 /DNA_START=485 /DNA_END=676 /DNA_ORIENTATION=-
MRPKASPNAEQPSARRNVVSTLPTAPRLSSAAQPETTGVHHPHLQGDVHRNPCRELTASLRKF